MNEVDAVFQPDDAFSLSLFFPFDPSLFDVDDSLVTSIDDSLVTPIDDSGTLIIF